MRKKNFFLLATVRLRGGPVASVKGEKSLTVAGGHRSEWEMEGRVEN